MAKKAKVEQAQSPVMVVKLPEGFKAPRAGSARAAWLERLVQHDGRTLAEFTESVTAAHPSEPQRGKLAGQLEPISGWIKYWTRQGVLSYTE